MKWILNMIPIPFLLLSGGCTDDITTEFKVRNLRCEYMNEAVVVKASPRFSWEILSTQNGQRQTAWHVIVSDDIKEIEAGKGTIWDSGKRRGDETFGIKWQEVRLQSFTKYY